MHRVPRELRAVPLVALLVVCLSAALPTPLESAQGTSGGCSPTAAVLLGRAYSLGAPVRVNPNASILEMAVLNDGIELERFVRQNAAHFGGNSEVVRCAQRLGLALLAHGSGAYDPKAADRALSRLPPELGHLAPDVGARVNEGAVQWMATGDYLGWLAGVLPHLAEGNSDVYLETGTWMINAARQQVVIARQMTAMLCQMDPSMCRQISTLGSHSPEYAQVLQLAHQYDRVMELMVVLMALQLQ